MKTPSDLSVFCPGDVFQINETFHAEAGSHNGWIGAFVMADEIRSWGIQGFVHVIETHQKSSQAWIRPKWEALEYIGRAVLRPDNVGKEEDGG